MRTEEEENRRAAEEAAKKIEEEKKRKEEDEIQKKQAGSEGFRLEDAQKGKRPIEQAGGVLRKGTQQEKDLIDQGEVQSDIDPLEPVVPFGSVVGEGSVSFSGVELIAFMPTKGEEVPDFNMIFYNKEKKRIVKRTEKKVNTRGKLE